MSEDRIEYEVPPLREREVELSLELLERAEHCLRFVRAEEGSGAAQIALERAAAFFQAYSTMRLVQSLGRTNEILERIQLELINIHGEM